jgi:hypothetical protein
VIADRKIYTQKDQGCQPIDREVRSSYVEWKHISLGTETNDVSEVK